MLQQDIRAGSGTGQVTVRGSGSFQFRKGKPEVLVSGLVLKPSDLFACRSCDPGEVARSVVKRPCRERAVLNQYLDCGDQRRRLQPAPAGQLDHVRDPVCFLWGCVGDEGHGDEAYVRAELAIAMCSKRAQRPIGRPGPSTLTRGAKEGVDEPSGGTGSQVEPACALELLPAEARFVNCQTAGQTWWQMNKAGAR